MKYEVIIFDADETLFDFKKAEQIAFNNLLTELKIKGDYYPLYHEINTQIWKEFEQGLITQEVLKKERFNRFIKQLNLEIDIDLMSIKYMNHLANASIVYQEAIKLVHILSKQYRLIIITNGLKNVQSKRIGKSSIAHYFEAIIISEVVGAAKPNPKIFEIGLDTINYHDKTKVLMVGDNLTSDILGGINFGIDTCWYNPHNLPNNTSIKPTYEIDQLQAIDKIL